MKIFGEGEWKIRKHGKEKRRVWRKLHLAVDAQTHAIIAAEVSLESVGDNEVMGTLLKTLRRRIEQISADGAYDTKACHKPLKNKGIKPVIPPRSNCSGIFAMRLWFRSKLAVYQTGISNITTVKGR